MSDRHLRWLERAAARGDPEAESRHLLERLRTGGLSWEQLDLAAYVGYAPARRLVQRPPAPLPTGPLELWQWLHGLRAWGTRAFVRGALAAGRAGRVASHRAADGEALDRLERWLSGAVPAGESAAASAARRLSGAACRAVSTPGDVEAIRRAVRDALVPTALAGAAARLRAA